MNVVLYFYRGKRLHNFSKNSFFKLKNIYLRLFKMYKNVNISNYAVLHTCCCIQRKPILVGFPFCD